MKTRTSASYVTAFSSALSFFKARNHPVTALKIDNETSEPLTNLFRTSSLYFQYAPPGNHRTLTAERDIRTAKNHLISILASTHLTFPSNRWDDLLRQAELTLAHLRPWRPQPTKSAWHGLHGSPFNFASHPIHPAGQLCVIHESPLTRPTWSPHGQRCFYLYPLHQHYRCHRVFVPSSSSYRTTDTLDHFPDPLFHFESPLSAPPPPPPDPLPVR